MKRRLRTHQTNPFYSSEPAVAVSLIADKPPIPSSGLGNKTPKMVDKSPGRISGLAGFADKHKLPQKKATILKSAKVPKSTTKVPTQGGHSRLGKPHRIGALSKFRGL